MSITTAPAPNVRVSLTGEESFPAYVDETRWNGAYNPRFARPVAEIIVEWMTTDPEFDYPEAERLRWDGDAIVITRDDVPDYAQRVEPDENGLYAIGENGWCWTAASDDDAEALDRGEVGLDDLRDDLRPVAVDSMREINEDISQGIVPIWVSHFGRLHDYVDANTYGGICDDDRAGHLNYTEQGFEDVRLIQEAVHAWLTAGRPPVEGVPAAEIARCRVCGRAIRNAEDGVDECEPAYHQS